MNDNARRGDAPPKPQPPKPGDPSVLEIAVRIACARIQEGGIKSAGALMGIPRSCFELAMAITRESRRRDFEVGGRRVASLHPRSDGRYELAIQREAFIDRCLVDTHDEAEAKLPEAVR